MFIIQATALFHGLFKEGDKFEKTQQLILGTGTATWLWRLVEYNYKYRDGINSFFLEKMSGFPGIG